MPNHIAVSSNILHHIVMKYEYCVIHYTCKNRCKKLNFIIRSYYYFQSFYKSNQKIKSISFYFEIKNERTTVTASTFHFTLILWGKSFPATLAISV